MRPDTWWGQNPHESIKMAWNTNVRFFAYRKHSGTTTGTVKGLSKNALSLKRTLTWRSLQRCAYESYLFFVYIEVLSSRFV
jgi:hypothetical protein